MADIALLTKLGIKGGSNLLVLKPPAGYLDRLGELPAATEMSTDCTLESVRQTILPYSPAATISIAFFP